MFNTTQQPPLFQSTKKSSPTFEQLIKIINTAFISTQLCEQNLSEDLQKHIKTPEFQYFVKMVKQFAEQENLSYQEAAESIVDTFRKVDKIWKEFVYQEGIKKLKQTPESS